MLICADSCWFVLICAYLYLPWSPRSGLKSSSSSSSESEPSFSSPIRPPPSSSFSSLPSGCVENFLHRFAQCAPIRQTDRSDLSFVSQAIWPPSGLKECVLHRFITLLYVVYIYSNVILVNVYRYLQTIITQSVNKTGDYMATNKQESRCDIDIVRPPTTPPRTRCDPLLDPPAHSPPCQILVEWLQVLPG
jgi:hypothetical protein